MKKDIWLKPGKELNTGPSSAASALPSILPCPHWNGGGLRCLRALAFGLGGGITPSSPHWTGREKDKDSVSYNHRVGHRRVGDPDAAAGSYDDHQRVTCAWSKAGKRNRKRRGRVCLSALFFYLTNTLWGYMMQTK